MTSLSGFTTTRAVGALPGEVRHFLQARLAEQGVHQLQHRVLGRVAANDEMLNGRLMSSLVKCKSQRGHRTPPACVGDVV